MQDDVPDDDMFEESLEFLSPLDPSDSMHAARRYLDGAGIISPRLSGNWGNVEGGLAIHHGRLETRISSQSFQEGSKVKIQRRGTAPLEETRFWLTGVGIGGFALAWLLSWINSRGEQFLSPFVTATFFLLGLIAVVTVFYVIDRSLERRCRELVHGLEDAMLGPWWQTLSARFLKLDRSAAVANGVLFYSAGLILIFLVYVIIWSDGIRDGINEAVTLDVMKATFAIPIVPAAIFGGFYYLVSRRNHLDRLMKLREEP